MCELVVVFATLLTLRPFARAPTRSFTEDSWEMRAWALAGSTRISSASLISNFHVNLGKVLGPGR
jgi:hypothetical protein